MGESFNAWMGIQKRKLSNVCKGYEECSLKLQFKS